MFWGYFSYDQKEPCHIWHKETSQEKEKAQKEIYQWNRVILDRFHAEWKLKQVARRLRVDGTRPRGKAPQWKLNEENGKRVRKATAGGIDWWRYGKEILMKKLIPFAERRQLTRLSTIVQEDKAPSHSHKAQQEIFDIHHIQRLLWPDNSPDLNMIEPCWPYMKRRTTVRGATLFVI